MHTNAVAHFEIYADDPATLAEFYTTLFDWQVQAMTGDYRYVKTVDTDANGVPTAPGGINGGIVKRPAGYPVAAAVNYVNVDSIEDAVTRATKLGARVTKEKAPVPGMGWFAMLMDPQGNHFAVWKNDPAAA
jgi:predicted enzyme related to lactoylglutathione lyase